MKIIRGTNKPIILEFDEIPEGSYITFKAALGNYLTTLKSWDNENIEVDGNFILLPLLETETLVFTPDRYQLEIKYLVDDLGIEMVEAIPIEIVNRFHNDELTGGEG